MARWTGPGIDSSTVASDLSSKYTTLGYSKYSALSGTGTWFGRSVDSNSIVVRYTYIGDADLGGTVDLTDYYKWKSSFNAVPGTLEQNWRNGDFNYSGTIDLTDYYAWKSSFNGYPATHPLPSLASAAGAGAALAASVSASLPTASSLAVPVAAVDIQPLQSLAPASSGGTAAHDVVLAQAAHGESNPSPEYPNPGAWLGTLESLAAQKSSSATAKLNDRAVERLLAAQGL